MNVSNDKQKLESANVSSGDSSPPLPSEQVVAKIDTMGGMVVQGDVTAKGDFVGRDKITNIFVRFRGLARWQALVLLLILGTVSLLLIITLLPLATQLLTPAIPTPDPEQVTAIESTKDISITALTANGNDLWIGAQSNEEYGLYRLDVTLKGAGRLERILATEADILQLMVDCKGNVWVLINKVGTLIYQPITGQYSTLIHSDTPGATLTKRTMFAVAHRCLDDGRVEVWLGREGVRTLLYDADYPTLDTITFVPEAQDSIYQDSKHLTDIQALLFTSTTQSLWIADRSGELLQASVSGMFTAKSIDSGSLQVTSLAQPYNSTTIWAGGDNSLTNVTATDKVQVRSLTQSNGAPLSKLIHALAVEDHRVWVGDSCNSTDTTCCPLGYVQEEKASCFTPKLSSVQALSIDEFGVLWIGTDSGLARYSASN